MFNALLGALGAVGGGLLTANSIDDQNAQAANQFSANMAFQKAQYEDMKRWQSPSNQVRLLREAGLNPALALDSKLAGNALTSVGGVAPTSSYTSGNFNNLPQVAGSLIDALSQNQLVEGQNAKNFSDAARGLQDSIGSAIENAYKHGDKKLGQFLLKKQGELAETDLAFQMSTFDRRVEQEQFKSALLMTQMEATSIANRFAPQKYREEISLLIGQTAAAYASRKLSLEQASEVIARKIASYGLDEDDALDLFDSSLDLIESQSTSNYGSAYHSFSGDLKSNPFILPVSGYQSGQVSNSYNTRIIRRNARKMLRRQRQNKK